MVPPFPELPNGIPSHDTFGRVFARLNPEQFQACFVAWVRDVVAATDDQGTDGQVVAIDGKTLRRSHDRTAGTAAIHMVSAWAAANRLVLGQVKVDAKSNEITAIPALLDLLVVRGGCPLGDRHDRRHGLPDGDRAPDRGARW